MTDKNVFRFAVFFNSDDTAFGDDDAVVEDDDLAGDEVVSLSDEDEIDPEALGLDDFDDLEGGEDDEELEGFSPVEDDSF